MKNRVVVICSDDITSLGLVRTLGEAGYAVDCICYAYNGLENNGLILASKYIHSGFKFIDKTDAFNYLLNEYPTFRDRKFLYTIPDDPAYFVDNHKRELEKKFILMSVSGVGSVKYWMNKSRQIELAIKYGFEVPWFVEVNRGDEIPESIEYPVFTKGVVSVEGGKSDEFICYNRDELHKAQDRIQSSRFFIMQYIEKVEEVNFFGLSIKGKVYIDYCDKRNRFPAGGYGAYNKFCRVSRDGFHCMLVNMIRETQYEGLFDIEFLRGKDGKLYFMEINFRCDGALYKLSPGINLPDMWYKLALVDECQLPENLPTKKDQFTGMSEEEDLKTNVLNGDLSFFTWFLQFLKADKRMLINLRDPKPFFVRLNKFIRSNFRRFANEK